MDPPSITRAEISTWETFHTTFFLRYLRKEWIWYIFPETSGQPRFYSLIKFMDESDISMKSLNSILEKHDLKDKFERFRREYYGKEFWRHVSISFRHRETDFRKQREISSSAGVPSDWGKNTNTHRTSENLSHITTQPRTRWSPSRVAITSMILCLYGIGSWAECSGKDHAGVSPLEFYENIDLDVIIVFEDIPWKKKPKIILRFCILLVRSSLDRRIIWIGSK